MFEIETTVDFQGEQYTLRCMTGANELELINGIKPGDPIPADRMVRALEQCLTGWQGATGMRGRELGDFAVAKVQWLTPARIDYLVAELMRFSSASEDEKKTSPDSPPSPPIPLSSNAKDATA